MHPYVWIMRALWVCVVLVCVIALFTSGYALAAGAFGAFVSEGLARISRIDEED